jgi:TctA family transporter
MLLGCLVGTLVGMLPGIAPAGISIPASRRSLDTKAIVMLAGIYYGSSTAAPPPPS